LALPGEAHTEDKETHSSKDANKYIRQKFLQAINFDEVFIIVKTAVFLNSIKKGILLMLQRAISTSYIHIIHITA